MLDVSLEGSRECPKNWQDVPGIKLVDVQGAGGPVVLHYLDAYLTLGQEGSGSVDGIQIKSGGRFLPKGPHSLALEAAAGTGQRFDAMADEAVLSLRHYVLTRIYMYAANVFKRVIQGPYLGSVDFVVDSIHAEDMEKPPILCAHVVTLKDQEILGRFAFATVWDAEDRQNKVLIRFVRGPVKLEVRRDNYAQAAIDMATAIRSYF